MEPRVHPTLIIEPLDAQRCRIVLREAVFGPEVRRFTSGPGSAGFPVAEALFRVPGISEVILSANAITIVKRSAASWQALEEQLRYAVELGLGASGRATASSGGGPTSDDAMFDAIEAILRTDINPAVAAHGGRIELLDVQDATAVVRMQGGCQGCGMASVTLRQGVEATLRELVPTLRGVRDITDHEAGTDPYFAPAKK